MPSEIDELIKNAKKMTDNEFKNEFSNLARLSNKDLEDVLEQSGIKQEEMAELLKIIKSASSSNETKAKAVEKIKNGTAALIAIAKKFL